ncbi:MAG: DUF4974 domain-containing protein [Algicola sp.]|nr:DUF4974 domain-containing protein [Algicola sp.]
MNREDLIKKWLDHDLNPQELEAFKNLEDYHALVALDQHLKGFKAESLDVEDAYNNVKGALAHKREKRMQPKTFILRIAAIIVVCLGVFWWTTTGDTTTNTVASQHKSLVLPDASEAQLNAVTTMVFNESDWEDNRQVQLNGEAFFKVSKGQQFDVITDLGTVTVLGTEFNVKSRDRYFEVTCYEGKVAVSTATNEATLFPGDRFLMIDGTVIPTEKETTSNPTWLNHKSSFKSIPFNQVVSEFERQYNVTIEVEQIDTSQSFTGSFTHNDIEIALKSITLPLQLKYSKTDNIIKLKRE